MKKWTVPFLFLLTVLLLISLAFLPALAGVLQDVGVEKEISSRPLHSIAPYISEKGSGLSFGEKLTALHESEISTIVPALASMTQEQVFAAVEQGIQPFVDAGIIRSFENLEFHATPYIAISWQDSQQFFLFWEVYAVEVSHDTKFTLSLRLDDETGKFLDLHYNDHDGAASERFWNEKSEKLDSFVRLWLEQSGLQDKVQALPHDQFPNQSVMSAMEFQVYVMDSGADRSLYMYFSMESYGEFTVWTEIMPQ